MRQKNQTKVINSKLYVIIWLQFELTYYDFAVKHVSDCTVVIP